MKSVVFLKSRLAHRGGLEKYTRRLAEGFAGAGCAVKILTTGECPSWDNIEVLSLGATSKLSLHHLRHFDHLCQTWLKENPADIVFGMERNTHQTHYRAGSGVHASYLKQRALTDGWLKQLSFKLNPLHRYLLKVEKEAFEDPSLQTLFTNSHMVKREILETYATPPEKIHVVHNGVEWKEKEAPFQESLKKPRSTPFHFLFVGNGFKRKGLSFLLQGLTRLQKPYQLTVVGGDKNLARFQNNKNVRFVGPQRDVTPYYMEADALVIPSIYDPFSNVTLEALAMGLYVVSSPFNGGHEVLTEESGTVIKDLLHMEEALETALNYPKTLERATSIRQSIKELDFSTQLAKIVHQTLC